MSLRSCGLQHCLIGSTIPPHVVPAKAGTHTARSIDCERSESRTTSLRQTSPCGYGSWLFRQDDSGGCGVRVRSSAALHGRDSRRDGIAAPGKAAIVRGSCHLDVPKSVFPFSRQLACRRQAVPCARAERLFQNHIVVSTSTESSMPLFISYVSYSQTGIKGMVDKPTD